MGIRMIVVACVVGLCGCTGGDREPPFWEQVKIGQLAPKDPNVPLAVLDTTNLDIYVFHVPVNHIKDLRGLWEGLNPRPVRYVNYEAFRLNGFRVAHCQLPKWDWVLGALAEVQARLSSVVTVWLDASKEHDLTVTALPTAARLHYTSEQGTGQQASLGPGMLGLRLRTDSMGAGSPARRLVACPVFTLGHGGPVERLAEVARKRDKSFLGAAFAVPIRQGDIVVLGPEQYCGDQSTLCGAFFREQQPGVVVDPTSAQVVSQVPVVRVYTIVCTRVASTGP